MLAWDLDYEAMAWDLDWASTWDLTPAWAMALASKACRHGYHISQQPIS